MRLNTNKTSCTRVAQISQVQLVCWWQGREAKDRDELVASTRRYISPSRLNPKQPACTRFGQISQVQLVRWWRKTEERVGWRRVGVASTSQGWTPIELFATSFPPFKVCLKAWFVPGFSMDLPPSEAEGVPSYRASSITSMLAGQIICPFTAKCTVYSCQMLDLNLEALSSLCCCTTVATLSCNQFFHTEAKAQNRKQVCLLVFLFNDLFFKAQRAVLCQLISRFKFQVFSSFAWQKDKY